MSDLLLQLTNKVYMKYINLGSGLSIIYSQNRSNVVPHGALILDFCNLQSIVYTDFCRKEKKC